jgi:glutathione S-transferase
MLTLYSTLLSANGRKVEAACHHLGLEPRIERVNVYAGEGRRPDYLQINPAGKIPTLVDGDLVLSESNAILLYLSESHGDLRLYSRDPAERAVIASWLFWEAAHWQPVLSLVLAASVGPLLRSGAGASRATEPDWKDERLLPLLARLEGSLRGRAFLAGEALSLADFSVGGMTTYFRATGFPFESHPRLSTWIARLEELDAWRATAVEPWR